MSASVLWEFRCDALDCEAFLALDGHPNVALARVRARSTAAEAERDRALARLAAIKAVVDEQAEDEGLWSLPLVEGTQPIMEAYLQQELRRLHAVIERES